MANYIDKDRLKVIVEESQKTGVIHDELYKAVIQIASGIIGRYRINSVEREDCVQDCVLHLIKILPRIDTSQNCFSYLTTCCFNVLRARIRQGKSYENLKVNLKKNLKLNQMK